MRNRVMRYLTAIMAIFAFANLSTQEAQAQCIISILNAPADTLDVPCGAAIQLERDTLGAYALFTDFNNGQVGLGWQTTSNASLTNPCGSGSNGSTYLWFGNSSTAPRNLRTTPLNMSCGGQVCFELRFSIQGQAAPCEGPDQPNEGVTFEFTTNGGATWTTIFDFIPNTGGSFNSQTPGSGDYTGWATYCYTLPPAASVNGVELRWQQYASTSAGFDHWGLDSITVQTFCGGVSNLWNTGDTTQFITTNNILTPTQYWVRRIVQPGGGSTAAQPDTCFDTVVVQPQLPQIPVDPTFDPFCTGNDAEVLVDFANAMFVDSNTNYNYSWAPAGVMDSTSIDYARKDDIVDDTVIFYNIEHPLYPQCSFTDTIDLNVGGVQIDSFNVINPLCYNEAVPSGEVNFFWSQNISSPITTLFRNGQFYASNFGATNFGGLPADTYQIAIRDSRCFDTLDFVITAADTLFIDTSNLVLDICQTSPTEQIASVINGIAPYTYYWDGTNSDTLSLQSNTDTTITIYAIDDVGCSSDSVDVTFVLPDPLSIEQFDTTVCEGVNLPIVARVTGGTGNYVYDWNTGDSSAIIIVEATQGEIYSVTVADGCMEPASMTANIDYLFAPEVGIIRSFTDSNNTDVTEPDNDILVQGYTPFNILFQPSVSDPAYTYFWDMWNNGNSDDTPYGWPVLSQPGDVDASFSYEKEGTYEVMLITTTEDGCIDTTYAIHEVKFRGAPPNVFTPNGDGINDYFYIPGSEAIRDFKLQIYNRWGRLVFETNNANNPQNGGGWDGAGHQDGVYYFIATGKRGTGEAYLEKGTITLTGSGS